MKQQIADYLQACYPAIYVVSHEERRVERILAAAAHHAKRRLFVWSATSGLREPGSGSSEKQSDEILGHVAMLPPKSLLILKDFHLFLDSRLESYPILVRKLKDSIRMAKQREICIAILASRRVLPEETEKLFVTIEVPLPDREELSSMLSDICHSNGIKLRDKNAVAAVVDAAQGLSEEEAENAFALSLVRDTKIDPKTVAKEKSRMIALGGILEVVEDEIPVDQIGGLDLLKEDLLSKRNLFSRDAWEFGITPPRGMLVVGQPGTGKSLTAKALKSIFNIPLLRLEAGRLFGRYIGESEENWRKVFATARASAPCILWIDEAEGLFGGSGNADSGVTQRIIKAILQDMQESSNGIFYCFTANDIDKIPDPVIDRLETWSVDLPDAAERAAIWRIQIAKQRGAKGWDPTALPEASMQQIVEASEGFSGRQIERAWEKALEVAFNLQSAPSDKGILAACSEIVPTSVTMAEAILLRQERLANRCRPASSKSTP